MEFYKTGIYRYTRLKYLQVLRANGSVHEVAFGVAYGCFVGLAVPTGLQLITLALSIPFFRFNKVLALLFIYITSNFFTLAFVYAAQTKLGAWLLGKDINEEIVQLCEALGNMDQSDLFDKMLQVLDCFLLGGFIFGTVCAVFSYFCTLKMVSCYRERRLGRSKCLS